MTKLDQANRYIQTHKESVDKTFKPQLHFTPEVGWMNDPNGFVYFRGEYHLFYQFNPYESVWGPMHWGHAKSKDLVNWEHLPVALAPDQDYDKDGCFSGSAIVKDDTLWLMYTGHIVNEDGSISQVQNMAFSTDGLHFEKIAQNPVATAASLPDELVANDFRDPKLFERQGRYYAVVATKHKDEVGCIVLLGSDDLLDWTFESILLKGEPHQGPVWECPDYFKVDGQDYLVISPMRYQQNGHDFLNLNSNIFVKGVLDWETKTFMPESFEEIDHGHDFYAAQTAEGPEGQRLLLGWMHTWGRRLVTTDLGHQWFGQMTLPRVLTSSDSRLKQGLTKAVLEVLADVELGEEITSPSKLRLDLSSEKDLLLHLGHSEDYLIIGYDHVKKEVFVDRSQLKIKQLGEENWPTERRSVSVDAKTLLVVIDTNCIELFINDGQETISSTVYVEGERSLSAV